MVVHNGTGTDGQAGNIAAELDRLGFDTSPGTGGCAAQSCRYKQALSGRAERPV